MAKNLFMDEDRLASVKRSIYIDGKPDVVVTLSVGYTRDELKHASGISLKRKALEAFRELLSAEDWEERTISIWEARTGQVIDVRAEDVK